VKITNGTATVSVEVSADGFRPAIGYNPEKALQKLRIRKSGDLLKCWNRLPCKYGAAVAKRRNTAAAVRSIRIAAVFMLKRCVYFSKLKKEKEKQR